jgi:hypothetical protein
MSSKLKESGRRRHCAMTLRDRGLAIWPVCGILNSVRDSTIAPPKGPRASEQGIRRPWFFQAGASRTIRWDFLNSLLPLLIFNVSYLSHQLSNPVYRSVHVDVISKFQMAGAIASQNFRGGVFRSAWCRWNALGGM